MNAFPLRVLRPISNILLAAEPNVTERETKRKKLLNLYKLLHQYPIRMESDWEQVKHHAEILGAMLHELDRLICRALLTKGATQDEIAYSRECLFVCASSTKLDQVLLTVSNRLEPVVKH